MATPILSKETRTAIYTNYIVPIFMSQAGTITIAEVEEIVEDGEISPEHVHVPGVYVQRVVKGESYKKQIEVSERS